MSPCLNGLEAFRKAGYTIVTTSSHQGTPLAQAQLPEKMVLVLGQEREGLSDPFSPAAEPAPAACPDGWRW